MKVTVYVKREDLVKLYNFLNNGEVLDICWAERTYLDFIQVHLDYKDYLDLLNISAKLEETPVEEVLEEEITFWELPAEDLKIFNVKGLFSLQQLTESFLAGSTYLANLQAQEKNVVFTKPVDFKTWFDINILQNATT